MIKINTKLIKKFGIYVGPVVSGVFTIMTEIEDQKLKRTVKELVKKVSDLEKR